MFMKEYIYLYIILGNHYFSNIYYYKIELTFYKY